MTTLELICVQVPLERLRQMDLPLALLPSDKVALLSKAGIGVASGPGQRRERRASGLRLAGAGASTLRQTHSAVSACHD